MPRPKSRVENDYCTAQNEGLYDEPCFYENPANDLGLSSLDVAAFTKNSSVYKHQSPKTHSVEIRHSHFEPMSCVDQTYKRGNSPRSLSRRMRCLVALNVLLSVLTIICLGLTSFLCYKVIIKDEGERCKGCDGGSLVTGKFCITIYFRCNGSIVVEAY